MSAPDPPDPAVALSGADRSVGHAVAMSAARVVEYAFGLVGGFLNAYILGPTGLGGLKTLGLISGYAGYNDFGMMKGMYLGLPIAQGSGDHERMERISNTAATNSVVTTLAAVIVLWALFLAGVTFNGALTVLTLSLLSAVLVFDTVGQFMDFYAKATGRFDAVARRDLIAGVAGPAVAIPCLLLWRIPGVLSGFLVIYVLKFVLLQSRLHLRVRPLWDRAMTFTLLRTGMLMMFNAFVGQIYWTLDLTLVAVMLSTREVGIYGFALGAFSLAEILPSSINRIVFQKMGFTRGRVGAGDPAAFRRYMGAPWLVYLLAAAMSTGLVALAYGVGVHAILRDYTDSVPVLTVMAGGYMFYTARGFSSTFLNVSDGLGRLAAIQLGGLAANVVFDVMLIPRYGLMGAAIGSSLSYLLFTYALVTVVLRAIFDDRAVLVAFLARLTFAFGICAGAIALIGMPGRSMLLQLQAWPARIGAGAALGVAQGLAYLLVCLATFLTVFRGEGLGAELRALVAMGRVGVRTRFGRRTIQVVDA